MTEPSDDLDKLLTEVRKTISENKQFLKTLLEDTPEAESEDEQEPAVGEEDFEEL